MREEPSAFATRGSGESEAVFERMQVPGKRVVHAREITLRRDPRRHVLAIDPPKVRVAPSRLSGLHPAAQIFHATRLGRNRHIARREVAINPVTGQARLHECNARNRDPPPSVCPLAADFPLYLLLFPPP